MTPNEILTASPLDLLFQNRNKQYGAYLLRKNYNIRLWTALGISLSILPLLFLLFDNGSSAQTEKQHGEIVYLRDFVPKKIKEPVIKPEKIVAQKTAVAQKKFITNIHIVDNNKTITPFTPQDQLNGFMPGTSNETGTPGNGLQFEARTVVTGPVESKPEVTPLKQSDPEYPGGVRAWLAFLQRNLRVPGDLGEGEKKTVLVRFQVSPEGMVTGFEILQSGGSEYDNEVIRVLKKMPRWKPAIQNNLPVARYFTQPVTFMGVGE